MLRTFTAAALALSLLGGAAFAQGNTTPANGAPATAAQPAKPDAQKTAVAPTIKSKAAHVRHVRHIKHARHVKHTRYAKHGGHIKHVKHTNHLKQVKGVKPSTEKTRG
jgi:hypothetical protein